MATYKTAMGKAIDIDSLRVANENVIAVGNMHTNARGDELGAGGKILKTRAQLMQEYHKLNAPVATHSEITTTGVKSTVKLVQPTADETPISMPSDDTEITSLFDDDDIEITSVDDDIEITSLDDDDDIEITSSLAGVKRI
jgi:hypothetical protein